MSVRNSGIERSPLLGISNRVFLVRLSLDLRINKAWICPPIQLARTSKGVIVLDRLIRRTSISAVLAAPLFGLALLLVGCSGEGGPRELTPEDKQNIADELKGAEDAKKNTEVRVRPSA